MPDINTIVSILWRYKKREKLTEEELIIMQDWMRESEKNQQLFEDLSNEDEWNRQLANFKKSDGKDLWKKIKQRVKDSKKETPLHKTGWVAYFTMAAILLGLLFGVYYYLFIVRRNESPSYTDEKSRYKNDIPSGGSHATLMLDNGTLVSLDSLAAGRLTMQGNTSMQKTDSGTLVYNQQSEKTDTSKKLLYNTLITPGGGEYSVVLPDSSKVWLNAASSLRYPLRFTCNMRSVELTGEGYFEIAKDKEKPFIVHTSRSSIRVLGTHFNVNAYPDEPSINTTLLEGSVSVSAGKDSVVMKPGQEIRLDKNGNISTVTASTEQVMAWRNKLFWFQDTPFDEVMKQLSRWYNLDVVYKDSIKTSFSGILPRDRPASALFHTLEKGGKLKFFIEGTQVTVSP